MASLEALETVVAMVADLGLLMTGWPRDPGRCLRLWPGSPPCECALRSEWLTCADHEQGHLAELTRESPLVLTWRLSFWHGSGTPDRLGLMLFGLPEMLANVMFDLAPVTISTDDRATVATTLSEAVATSGLLVDRLTCRATASTSLRPPDAGSAGVVGFGDDRIRRWRGRWPRVRTVRRHDVAWCGRRG